LTPLDLLVRLPCTGHLVVALLEGQGDDARPASGV
jgi:hypothetical protein